MEFNRPEGSRYPIIYESFEVKSKKSDENEEFYIQDLTENFFDEAVQIIVDNHAKGAVFHRAANTLIDEKGFERVREMYRNVFKEKISLICMKKGSNEIVGINALTFKTKSTLLNKVSTDDPNYNLLKETITYINFRADIMNFYGVDKAIFATGLCVIEKYRGKGIATKILQARVPLMKNIGIEATSTIFTTIGAQKAAKAAGYDETFMISFDDLHEKFPTLNFQHAEAKFVKVMTMKV